MPTTKIKWLLIGLGASLIAGTLWLLWQINLLVKEVPPEADKQPQPVALQEPQPVRVEARWLLAGEVFWGRQMERVAEQQAKPESYLFSQLGTFERDKYDAWLAQLECPVADKVIPFSVQANDLIFNCRPEYLPEFAKWFDAASLANNHMDNVDGTVGLEQTRDNLEEAGIQYYGHYDNSVLSDICEVVTLPVRIIMSDDSSKAASIPIALCGYHNVYRLPTEAELDVISRYSKHFFTIASPQQGAEYEPVADELKVRIYRAMIDRGADLVVASHPHWVQNTEVYKGKLIMYSIGNFMFDQEWSEDTKRGVALDLKLSVAYDDDLAKLMELGPACLKFQDDCLEQKPVKPEFNAEFDLVSGYHENVLTRWAPASVHELNLKRTNWAQTLEELGQNSR